VFNFFDVKEFKMSKADAVNWAPYLKWGTPIIIFFGLSYFILGKLLNALLLSLIGLALCRVKKVALSYSGVFNIMVYVLTLPTIIQVLKGYILPRFPYFGLLYYIIIGIYLWKAVKATKEEAEPPAIIA